ncbi:MAG: alpha/beta hydrolase [Anaerolineae bacterium]|nr:alpha/beta hydrolase [Anaerolineae bacterium]
MPTLSIDEQRLYYTDNRVRQESPSLVLLHGAGGTHLSWGEVRLVKFAAAYALDLPGHGRSPLPGRASIEAYADVVMAFVTQLGLTNVVVGGISMGGAIAQVIGLRQPDWLSGLVLVGTAANLPVAEAIMGRIFSEFQAAMRLVAKLEWPKGTDERIVERSYQELASHTPQVVYDDFAACHLFDVRPQLAQIQVPSLVIAGDHDRLTPLPQLEFLAQNLPQARLVVVAEAGHMVALARPQAVIEAIEQWLAESGLIK